MAILKKNKKIVKYKKGTSVLDIYKALVETIEKSPNPRKYAILQTLKSIKDEL